MAIEMIEEKTRVPNDPDLPAPIRNFMEETRRLLIAVRVKHGAESPIGHRCSNIVELLRNRGSPTLIAKQMKELDQLLNG